MVSMMGCLVRDNNDNNDANALHRLPRRDGKKLQQGEIEGRYVSEPEEFGGGEEG